MEHKLRRNHRLMYREYLFIPDLYYSKIHWKVILFSFLFSFFIDWLDGGLSIIILIWIEN